MSKFTDKLVVTDVDDKRWMLESSFTFHTGPGKDQGFKIIVPKGFITDFASVPKGLHWLYGPWGDYGKAAVLHDWLYVTEFFDRRTCDAIFLQAMKVLGVGFIRRHIIFKAVRYFGWLVWRSHDPATVRKWRILGGIIQDDV